MTGVRTFVRIAVSGLWLSCGSEKVPSVDRLDAGPHRDGDVVGQVETAVGVEIRSWENLFDVSISGAGAENRRSWLREEYVNATFVASVYLASSGALIDEKEFSFYCHRAAPLSLEERKAVTSERFSLHVSNNGQVFLENVSCFAPEFSFVADGFPPQCWPGDPCEGEGRSCGIALVHEEPALYHLRCREEGELAIGEECSYDVPGLDSGGGCTRGTACVDGVCRGMCVPVADDCPDAATECSSFGGTLGVGICEEQSL